MYEFSNEEAAFLREFSESNDGMRLKKLLSSVRISISDISKVKGGDYGAQVEGRKIALEFIDSLLENMKKRDSAFAQPKKRDQSDKDDWT